MSSVRLYIAGREYDVACDDGEEAHLKTLAHTLDIKMRTLGGDSLGRIPEAQLIMLAALTITDELQDKTRELGALRHDITHSSQSFEQNKQIELENAITVTLNDIASRVENLALELEMLE